MGISPGGQVVDRAESGVLEGRTVARAQASGADRGGRRVLWEVDRAVHRAQGVRVRCAALGRPEEA